MGGGRQEATRRPASSGQQHLQGWSKAEDPKGVAAGCGGPSGKRRSPPISGKGPWKLRCALARRHFQDRRPGFIGVAANKQRHPARSGRKGRSGRASRSGGTCRLARNRQARPACKPACQRGSGDKAAPWKAKRSADAPECDHYPRAPSSKAQFAKIEPCQHQRLQPDGRDRPKAKARWRSAPAQSHASAVAPQREGPKIAQTSELELPCWPPIGKIETFATLRGDGVLLKLGRSWG